MNVSEERDSRESTMGASERALKFSKDVLYAGLVDAVSKGVVIAGAAALGAVGVLIWKGGSVPTWTAVLAVLVVVAVALTLSRRRARELSRARASESTLHEQVNQLQTRVGELEPLHDEISTLKTEEQRLTWGLERHETYGAHVSEMLGHLQRVLSGDIPGVSIPDFIERGILAPARDLLAESPAEDVRLSVLLPAGDDKFQMQWAAGHSFESQQKYSFPIADSLSRLAYDQGVPYLWGDVHDDDRFEANPHATRDFHAMVSLPIRVGDRVLGVFNTISGEPDAFDSADINYIASLGSVIDVAVTVHAKERGLTGQAGDAE